MPVSRAIQSLEVCVLNIGARSCDSSARDSLASATVSDSTCERNVCGSGREGFGCPTASRQNDCVRGATSELGLDASVAAFA